MRASINIFAVPTPLMTAGLGGILDERTRSIEDESGRIIMPDVPVPPPTNLTDENSKNITDDLDVPLGPDN